jgi:hypothetical protein
MTGNVSLTAGPDWWLARYRPAANPAAPTAATTSVHRSAALTPDLATQTALASK